MKYHWRIFLWENGGKSTEYTKKVVPPIFVEDHLDETMDGGEIILDNMPISTRNAFPPKTKFRLERYTTKDYTDEPKKYDLIVEHDDVEEYSGVPNICCHRINIIEASVVAQGMHVDNIALTYELQDVNLNYKTIRSDATTIEDYNTYTVSSGGYNAAIRQSDDIMMPIIGLPVTFTIEGYFKNSYRYDWDNSSIDSIRELKLNLSAAQVNAISFTVPKLMCRGCYNSGTWSDLFEMNTITRVYEIRRLGSQELSSKLITTFNSGAASLPIANDSVFYSNGAQASLRKIQDLNESGVVNYPITFGLLYETHPAIATANSSYSNKTVKFNTTQLSETEISQGYNFLYRIECYANPTNQNGMLEYYETRYNAYHNQVIHITPDYAKTTNIAATIFYSNSIHVNASFNSTNMSVDAEGGPFLMKGVKYSCFDLLRKALLTVDTQIIDNSKIGLDSVLDENYKEIGIQYPIILHPDWNNRLKVAKMQETIFEGKNLWEVLLQIGYYLHAIPYFIYSEDDDRFILTFRQLGATKTKDDSSTKITIFNSKNLSEYFTQYDSYVTNMFSPQNIVEEWIVAKTSSEDYLVSNDTAELITSRPLLEVMEFDITYDGSAGGNAGTKSALQYIFEESIYQILTTDNPMKIRPAKGNSIYFSLSSNKIQGLNYVPPQSSGGTFYLALQEICRQLFGVGSNFVPANLKFNSLVFHIKYRTQDSLRISQVRPDIENFMKNSSYEKYPHHEQFYGQQDKIIDSERFSANLWGRLIRVGNNIYQRQEYVDNAGQEKESGDLVVIKGDTYYVISTENEYYPDVILQKVTYSKNFNQLSNIVTIPSEPRFYEVSERSKIRREVRMMDFFVLSTTKNTSASKPRYLNSATWKDFIKRLIFNKNTITLPNFAYTKFVADYKRQHIGSYGQYVSPEQLFPSSEINRTDPNNIMPMQPSDHADCIVPVLHFPLHDGIVFEWDMEDNFKVGDFKNSALSGGTGNQAYETLQPYRYCDIMGRADLFTFKLFNKTNWTKEQVKGIPKAVIIPNDSECQALLPAPYLIGLDKDNREEISFNYQINLLHKASEGDDDFITFPNLFGQKDSPLKMCLLSEPQSLFNENINLSPANILADNVTYNLIDDNVNEEIEIKITQPNGINMSQVKSIILYQEDEKGGRYAYIVKNVNKLINSNKLQSWWLYPVFNM